MSQGLVIETLTGEDLDELMTIENDSFPSPWSRPSYVEALHRANYLFLALRQKGRLIGYSLSLRVVDELHILKLAVTAEFRRKGLGARLLKETIRRAPLDNIRVAWLEVRPTNEAALALYEANGFCASFVRKGYYADSGEDAIVLARHFQQGKHETG